MQLPGAGGPHSNPPQMSRRQHFSFPGQSASSSHLGFGSLHIGRGLGITNTGHWPGFGTVQRNTYVRMSAVATVAVRRGVSMFVCMMRLTIHLPIRFMFVEDS